MRTRARADCPPSWLLQASRDGLRTLADARRDCPMESRSILQARRECVLRGDYPKTISARYKGSEGLIDFALERL